MTKYGFYSAQAAARYGSYFYSTPNGSWIEVTLATDIASSLEEVRRFYHWPDTIFLGPVSECVKMNTKWQHEIAEGQLKSGWSFKGIMLKLKHFFK